ncbi:hypothetical protein BVRB_1g021430 [Beta vulgaris subsp. vulgaris]|nr:hypothetical protein BVRB_1g021430 [Beta vulgaris subsp. vulgaris]
MFATRAAPGGRPTMPKARETPPLCFLFTSPLSPHGGTCRQKRGSYCSYLG